MKIFAESQVPDSLPYMHIGYLATTTPKPNTPSLMFGLILLLIGIVVSVKQKANKLKNRKVPIYKKFLSKGFLITVLSIIVITLSIFVFGKFVYVHAEDMTEHNVEIVFSTIKDYLETSRDIDEYILIPEDVDKFADLTGTRINLVKDGWFNPFRIKKEKVNGKDVYFVISAGEDEIFDTPDDIIFPDPEEIKTQTQKNN